MRHPAWFRSSLTAFPIFLAVALIASAQDTAPRVDGPSFEGRVAPALKSQPNLIARREHCSIDPDRLRAIGRKVGQQVRIEREGGGSAFFTVTEARDEMPEALIRVGKMGRAKLGPGTASPTEIPVRVYATVPHPTLSESDARRLGECVERSDDDGVATGLLVLAPHAGDIEPHTDEQAEHLAAVLTGPGKPPVTTWRCKGHALPDGPSAAARWHITSTETSEASFPLLGRIARREFAYTVSFHGMSREAVLIGGRAPDELKRALQAEITRALEGSGIPVVLAVEGEANGGYSPRNIVNRYCHGTGIQIEQSPRARRDYWRAIADAVARVYATRL